MVRGREGYCQLCSALFLVQKVRMFSSRSDVLISLHELGILILIADGARSGMRQDYEVGTFGMTSISSPRHGFTVALAACGPGTIS